MYKKIYKNMCFASMITLILSAVMILSATHSAFYRQSEKEIVAEAKMLSAFLNESENQDYLNDFSENYEKVRLITLHSNSGAVLYKNGTYIKNSDNTINLAVSLAAQNGYGSAYGYSIFGMTDFFSYSIKLENGNILCISGKSVNFSEMFPQILVALIFITAFIYLISVIIAKRLTRNIVKPIENLYSFDSESLDGVYEEIRPFLYRIAAQNDEINRQMDKVKAQKIRLQTITENMNEGLIIFDRRGTVLTANNCICELFDTSEGSIKYRELSRLTQNRELKEALSLALEGKKSYLITQIGERSFQIFYSPVFQNDKINAVVMLLFDVSERREAENMRREFSANVSHELKTPLTTIHGYSQIINQGFAKPEDILGFTQKIEKESSRLITLIDDIIKLSSLDEGSIEYEKQQINLKTVATEVSDVLTQRAAEKNISLSISGEDSFVFANLSQISELMYNLVDNAIKYNCDGGCVDIKIDSGKFAVSDTGIGIEEEYYDRIFERFFRIDKSRSKKVNGTGLGLSIVKHLAQANNALIDVKSTLGEGTEFTVTFLPQISV